MRCFKLLVILIVALLSFSIGVQAQISHADSAYLNNICKEGMYISYWNYPGAWYHQNEISSVQNFYDQVNSSYLFNNDEFADCYHSITTATEMERDTAVNQTLDNFEIAHNVMLFGHKNPFVKLKFDLNNKSAYSYALLDSTSKPVYDNEAAFVIISGTGTNQIKTIFDGNGYHDVNCYVRNLLKPMGDIYIMSMPNEDHRAIYFNKKKASSLPSFTPPYMISYLNAANKSLGLNRLIETVAFIKFLKGRYKKVFVLGLSTGGKVALWASMLSEPDASLIASGYSVLVDNDYNSQIINSMSYGNYLLVYDQDSTKARIAQLHTQMLFTQAQNDNAVTQYDLDNKITENFLLPTGNTSFFSNMVNHAFPPCPVIDSFFQRCFKMAKVVLTTDTTVCSKDSLVMKLHFYGKAPFNFQLFKNGMLYSTHYSPDTNFQITLFDEGQYLVKNLLDSAGVIGYTSDTFFYQKDLQPGAFLTKGAFLCDSNKTRVVANFQGQSPFVLHYTKNNIADSILLMNHVDSALLIGGNYHFVDIRDANNCLNSLSTSMNLYDGDLDLHVGSIQYNCIANTNNVPLSVSGLLPVTLTFYDSALVSYRFKILNNVAESLDLDSGAYRFVSIKDSNNCTQILDSSLLIQSEPVSLSYDTMTYYCNSNFASLPIHLSGKSSWVIQLEHDGVITNVVKSNKEDSLHIQSGISKIVSIQDGNNCIVKIRDSILLNSFRQLSANVFTGMFDCSANQKAIELHAAGNMPLQVYGHRGVQQFAGTYLQFPQPYLLSPGTFAIDSIVDARSCKLQNIYSALVINDTIDVGDIFQDKFAIKTSQLSTQRYYWYLNDVLYRETTEPFVDIDRSGHYDLGIYNNNNCFLKTKKLKVDLGKMLLSPNPADDKLTVMMQFDPGESVQYFLTDLTGKKILSGSLQNGKNLILLPEMPKGMYILQLMTNLKNVSYPSQRILKN